MVEKHYCNSVAPVVVLCTGCLVVPVEHSRDNLVVAEDGTIGVAVAETAEVAAVETAGVIVVETVGAIGLGMPPGGTAVDIG